MRLTESSHLADQRITEWFLLEKGHREREKALAERKERQIVAITISRQFGAGGRTVANGIAASLGHGWQIWDREIIELIAQDAKVRVEMAEAMDEHARSWVDDVVRSLFTSRGMESQQYRHYLVRTMLTLAQQGKKILIGRAGNLVLPTALNIRLRASLDARIPAVMALEGLDRDAASKRIQHVDAERAEFARLLFGKDIDDINAYDMVLATDELTMPATTAAICAAARVKFGLP